MNKLIEGLKYIDVYVTTVVTTTTTGIVRVVATEKEYTDHAEAAVAAEFEQSLPKRLYVREGDSRKETKVKYTGHVNPEDDHSGFFPIRTQGAADFIAKRQPSLAVIIAESQSLLAEPQLWQKAVIEARVAEGSHEEK